MLAALIAVPAQETPVDNQNQNPPARPFKIFEELGLTPDQVQQIRRINQERKPIVQAAQVRWREANRRLDIAIYADDSTEDQVKELTRIAQFAQSELLKERTITEFQIRRVLTPEQLVKFRQLRQMLADRVREMKDRDNPNRRNDQPQRPFNRLQQRRNNNRPQD